jgi:membrane-bound lytic murein transglycosylase B
MPLADADLPAVREAFVQTTAARYGLPADAIRATLDDAEIKPAIIAAMRRPAEAKPWRDYRPIFITDARIAASARFMQEHAAALARAERQTGVPAEIVTAIIGVETGFGANQGRFRVLDALYTLAFAYPRSGDPTTAERERQREWFFRDELAQLFALANEDHLDITALRGSYAGAMGWGQFMPSSWRAYAVDGDGDGKRDLFDDPDDVIASVANYFLERGQWLRGGQVMTLAARAADAPAPPAPWQDMRPLADWARVGVRPLGLVDDADAPAGLLLLDGAQGSEAWLVFDNFRAITKYNTSSLYATAVYQLAEAALAASRAATAASDAAPLPAAVPAATP